MFSIEVDEFSLLAAVGLLGAAVLSLAILRLGFRLVAVAVTHIIGRYVGTSVETATCIACMLVTVFVFGDRSVLTLPLFLLSCATGFALCWSSCSFRWVVATGFSVSCLLLTQVIAPHFVSIVDPFATEWQSIIRGQQIIVAPPLSRSSEQNSRYLYIYYDEVHLRSARTPFASVAGTSSTKSDLPVWSLLPLARQAMTWMPNRPGRSQGICGIDNPAVQYLVSASEATAVLDYGSSTSTTLDTVYLLGEGSSLTNIHLHCMEDGTSSCLHLRVDTILKNVTISLYSPPSSAEGPPDALPKPSASILIGDSLTLCVEAQSQLRRLQGVKATPLIHCATELDLTGLPPRYQQQAPALVRCRWKFPQYMKQLHLAFVFVMDYAIYPIARWLASFSQVACQVLRAMLEKLRDGMRLAAPHVRRGLHWVCVYLCGLICGPSHLNLDTATAPSSWCLASATAYRSSAAYRAGIRSHETVLSLFSSMAETLDLVPGVWSMYSWAWRVEWRATQVLLRAWHCVLSFIFYTAPLPVARLLYAVLTSMAELITLAAMPLRHAWDILCHGGVGSFLSQCSRWLWAKEVSLLSAEWDLLRHLSWFVLSRSAKAVEVAWNGVAVVYKSVLRCMKWYSTTSFSIHIFVVLAQSVLLVIAMRNEMSALVAQEEEQQQKRRQQQRAIAGSKYNVLRIIPSSVTNWVPMRSAMTRFYGFILLIHAHQNACIQYVLHHGVLFFVLIGLSVVPFAGKLYAFTLRYVLVWVSSKGFLLFFTESPTMQQMLLYGVGRIAVTLLLQRTLGDFLYYLLKDLLIAGLLIGGTALVVWAWPQRKTIVQQVSAAITESLHNSPLGTPTRMSLERQESPSFRASHARSLTFSNGREAIKEQEAEPSSPLPVKPAINGTDARE